MSASASASASLDVSTALTVDSLFNNSFLSDITIRQVCDDSSKDYYAHKAVLCAHSEYFMRMFSGNFKVTATLHYEFYLC